MSSTNFVNIPNCQVWVNTGATISTAPENVVITGVNLSFGGFHFSASDLELDLKDGDATRSYLAWNREGESSYSGGSLGYSKSISGITTFNGMSANGVWRLWASDQTCYCPPDWSPCSNPEGSLGTWEMTAFYEVDTNGDGVPDNVDDDDDGDGMTDIWETTYGLDPHDPSDATGDADGDGLTNLEEYGIGSRPDLTDSDGDGMPDGWEFANRLWPTDPLDAAWDLDGDGLTSLQEFQLETDPNKTDTDSDGMPDDWEYRNGFNPIDPSDAAMDDDNDGLSNLQEYLNHTNPHDSDTDNDGLPDGWEVRFGFNPLSNVNLPPSMQDGDTDYDHDGLTALEEFQLGTNPNISDTDGDGIPDGWEVAYGLNPLVQDAHHDLDGDGRNNYVEYLQGTNPIVQDGAFSITASASSGGTIAPTSALVNYGDDQTFTMTPSAGYVQADLRIDGVSIGAGQESYTFTNVTRAHAIEVAFAQTSGDLSITPSFVNYGNVPAGISSPARTLVLTNATASPLFIGIASLTGNDSSDFAMSTDNCSGRTLAAAATCSIQVIFSPATSGTKVASISIPTGNPVNTHRLVSLCGYSGLPVQSLSTGAVSGYYATIGEALSSVAHGNVVNLLSADFNENITFSRSVTVTISGGYNAIFTDKTGKSVLQGSLTISHGTVVVDGLQIGGSSYHSGLTVTVDTPSSGTINSDPTGINCSGSCSSAFVTGDIVTLTASPVGDSVFIGWSGGGCSGTGNCVVSMTGNIAVTASFSAAKIAVAPASESFGTAYIGTSTTPQTITVTSSGTHDLIIGILSLSGANASDFIMSADNCSGHTLASAATCTVQVSFVPSLTGARTASLLIPSNDPQTPAFSASLNGIGKYPTLTVSKTGNGAGTVTSSSGGINCGSSCSAAFTLNTEVTLAATPDFGYTFTGWSGACSGAGSCTLTMDADHTATATFIETPIASCSANPVMVNGTLYSSIQAAYNAAADNSIIKLLATDIYESFIANRGITVTIDGGYKCSFTTSSGTTVIHGAPDIAAGAVTLINASINQ